MHSFEHSRSWVDFLGPPGLELVGVLLQEHVPNLEAVRERAGLGWHLVWPELKLQPDIAYSTAERTAAATTASAAG